MFKVARKITCKLQPSCVFNQLKYSQWRSSC